MCPPDRVPLTPAERGRPTMAPRAAAPSNVVIDGDRAIVPVTDADFDNAADESPGQRLFRLVEDLGRSDVALDFEAVHFLGSIGLTILLTLNKQLRAAGGRLTLFNVRPPVSEVFAV